MKKFTKTYVENGRTGYEGIGLYNFTEPTDLREMINNCRERRNQLADGHFWENSWNVNEDTALVIAITTLQELIKEE